MEFISGENRNQIILLPGSVEDYVEDNNAVRVIDAYINSLDLAVLGFSRPQPHETGRPMYDPRDLLKLYVYGYMNRLRSSRRLETETKRNLEVMWLLGKLSPDHKTIANFRHENGAALKNVFRDFVGLCVKLGLYGKELAAIDGSKFKAVNSKERNFTKGKLRDRIAHLEAQIGEYLRELEDNDGKENTSGGEKNTAEIKGIVTELSRRKGRYEAYAEDLERTGETQKSLTDPDSRLMAANGKMEVCYNVQTAVDAKNKLVVEFEVTNEGTDNNQITPMVERTKAILGTDTVAVVADAGYGSVQDIVESMAHGATPHIAGTDFDVCVPTDEPPSATLVLHKDGRCVYIAGRNMVLCPMGNILYPRFYKKPIKQGVFYNRKACKICVCKCTTEERGHRHQVTMTEEDFLRPYTDARLFVKQIRIRPGKWILGQRKSIVEHPFGTIKRSMDAAYCLTRGLRNVTGEFSLTFLAYNLKRVITILGCKKLMECLTG
jgi:transposase